MTRQISPAIITEVENAHVNIAFLLSLDLDVSPLYLWSGLGSLNWDGKIWQGVGALGALSAINEDTDLSDVRIKANLSHLPIESLPDFVTEFASNDPVGRPFKIYLAFLNDDTSMNDVVLLTAGFIDGLSLSEAVTGAGENMGGIELTLASEAALLKQTRLYRFTDQHQKSLFPSDRGLEFVTDTNLGEIRWGQADPQKIPASGFSGKKGFEFDRGLNR